MYYSSLDRLDIMSRSGLEQVSKLIVSTCSDMSSASLLRYLYKRTAGPITFANEEIASFIRTYKPTIDRSARDDRPDISWVCDILYIQPTKQML